MKNKEILIRSILFGTIWVCAAIILEYSLARADEWQVSLSGGWHSWDSGHTFTGSTKDDDEFESWSALIDLTYWPWEGVGFYGYLRTNDSVDEVMWEGFRYENDLNSCGMGMKYRWLFDKTMLYVGAGANYTLLENEYHYDSGTRSEELDSNGVDALLGIQHVISDRWFIGLRGMYSQAEMKSGLLPSVTFKPGGVFVGLELGVRK